jgi:hypothetical protein
VTVPSLTPSLGNVERRGWVAMTLLRVLRRNPRQGARLSRKGKRDTPGTRALAMHGKQYLLSDRGAPPEGTWHRGA